MTDWIWNGLGVADGTTITDANVRTSGNGDGTIAWAQSGSPTAVYDRDANGNGASITGPLSAVARFDAPAAAANANLIAAQIVYVPSGVPTTADSGLIVGRTTAAAFSGQLLHSTADTVKVMNGPGTLLTTSPTLGSGRFQIDFATIRNTLTTPSTTNGRIMARIRSLSNPGGWNGGAEWYYDSGYTVNVTVDPMSFFRIGKTTSGAVVPEFKAWNLKGKDAVPITSTTKASAVANFVADTTVEDLAVTATVTPTSGVGPLAVSVSAFVTGGTGTTVQYTFAWGDGTANTGPQTSNTATHTYAAVSSATVRNGTVTAVNT